MERALLTIVFLVLWFLPLMIAGLYKLPHQGRIAVLSIALGWTGVAWLAALTIVIGGAIRATEPRAQGSRGWPDGLVRPQARAPDSGAAWAPDVPASRPPDVPASRPPDVPASRPPDVPASRAPDVGPGSAAQGPDSPARPQVRAPDVATAPEPPPPEQQPSFPPVRSPWPGRQQ